jgi:hypothetical protein
LLLDITGWRPEEIDDGVSFLTELGLRQCGVNAFTREGGAVEVTSSYFPSLWSAAKS